MRSLFVVSPQLVLCTGSLVVLVTGLWVRAHEVLLSLTLGFLAIAASLFMTMHGRPPQDAFAGMIVHDGFAQFFALFAVLSVTLCVAMSARSKEIADERRAEFYALLLALSTGLVFMG